jgi:hypothetical protein
MAREAAGRPRRREHRQAPRLYVDAETDEPQFATVKVGLIGRHLTFVPLDDGLVLGGAIPEPERDLDPLGADARGEDAAAAFSSIPSSISAAKHTSESERALRIRRQRNLVLPVGSARP